MSLSGPTDGAVAPTSSAGIVRPRVVLASMAHDYGRPEWGTSNEFYNLYQPLRATADVTFYDYIQRLSALGREAMNGELLALVERERPDVTIVALYRDEFLPSTIGAMRRWTTTVAFLYDDSWRRRYSCFWAGHFDFVTTSEPEGFDHFEHDGVRNVLLSPFGFNADLYRRLDLPIRYQLSFFGFPHPYRVWLIERIRRAGFEVIAHGPGWPGSKVSVEEMIEIINQTAINLNLSNSKHWEFPYLMSSPKALAWNLLRHKVGEQIKGRHFEIAGCGAFQLSHEVPSLRHFFQIGEEIVTYSSADDLVAKVRYYLTHEEERRGVAERGWRRAQRGHTSQGYLASLLQQALERRPARA